MGLLAQIPLVYYHKCQYKGEAHELTFILIWMSPQTSSRISIAATLACRLNCKKAVVIATEQISIVPLIRNYVSILSKKKKKKKGNRFILMGT